MKKILVMIMMAVATLGIGAIATQPVWADDICSEFGGELGDAAGCNASGTTTDVAHGLIDIALGVMPIIAVGVMIYGGFTYMTSQGDSGKITKARNILIYGAVGLAVSMLAYALVEFVFKNVLFGA